MKKTILALAFAVAVLGAMAQRPTLSNSNGHTTFRPADQLVFQKSLPKTSYTHYIDSWYSSDELDIVNYFYVNNRCTGIERIDNSADYMHSFDSLTYDANGNIIRNDGYQEMPYGWKHNDYVTYEYDSQNRLITRTNTPLMEGASGGVYHFEYDDQGRLALRWLFFFGTRYDELHYTYDDQGRLSSTLQKIYDFGTNQLTDYSKDEYTYGDNGLVSTVQTYDWDASNGWMARTRKTYAYNENGDMILYEAFLGNTITERRQYEFDNSHPLSETYHPRCFDIDEPHLYDNVNTYSIMHWHMADQQDVLQYVCDYHYEYTTTPSSSAGHIPHLTIDQAQTLALTLYPNPATDHLTIEGQPGDNMLHIYSLSGSLVHMQRLFGHDTTVDLSSLTAGTYLVRVSGQQTRTAKIIVK